MKKSAIIKIFFSIIILLVVFFCFKSVKELKTSQNNTQNFANVCKQNELYEIDENYTNYCNEVINSLEVKIDFFTYLFNTIVWYVRFLNPCAFLIIGIPIIISTCSLLKNKLIINYLPRKNYSSFLNYYFKNAYKFLFIIPLIGTIIIVIGIVFFTLDPSYSIKYTTSIWSGFEFKPIFFIVLYLFNLLLYSIFYMNIALIVSRYQHKEFISIIIYILSIIGFEIFLETIGVLFCNKVINNSSLAATLNILNLFTFNTSYGMVNMVLFPLILSLISILIVFLIYKNKEKLVISCEKNN